MAISRNHHPRIEAAYRSHLDKLEKRHKEGPWFFIYAERHVVDVSSCGGQYVIENPKVDEILKVHVWRGRTMVVRLRTIRHDGVKSVGEERYDGDRMVHRLLTEAGSPLTGQVHFRTIDQPATVVGQGAKP